MSKNEQEDIFFDNYDYDYCDECRLYGDDYFFDEDGELESYCPKCTMNPSNDDYYDS